MKTEEELREMAQQIDSDEIGEASAKLGTFGVLCGATLPDKFDPEATADAIEAMADQVRCLKYSKRFAECEKVVFIPRQGRRKTLREQVRSGEVIKFWDRQPTEEELLQFSDEGPRNWWLHIIVKGWVPGGEEMENTHREEVASARRTAKITVVSKWKGLEAPFISRPLSHEPVLAPGAIK